MIINEKQLLQFRNAFQSNADAVEAISIIEQHDGNLVDAIDTLMSIEKDDYHLGDDDNWIDFENIAKDLYAVICHSEFKALFVDRQYPAILGYLMAHSSYTAMLLVPLIIYLSQLGYDCFCNSKKP
jgi:hypothetical protein